MNLRHFIAVAVLPLACLATTGAQETGGALVERARADRRAAQQDLARMRQERLKEREQIAAELNSLYGRLDEARTTLSTLDRELTELRRETGDTEEQSRAAETEARQAAARAATELGVSLPADFTSEELEALLSSHLAKRIDQVRRGTELRTTAETVLDRDGNPTQTQVLHVGSYAAYACGDGDNVCGILTRHADGEPAQVVGPILSPEQKAHLRELMAGRPAPVLLALDDSLLAQAPRPPATVRNWLAKGGAFVYPILVVAALGVLIILERLAYLNLSGTRRAVVDQALGGLVQGTPDVAHAALKSVKTPAARVLRAAADACDRPAAQREAAMESALLLEAPHLERGLSLLAALAGVAPLLGLLGTVSGMVSTFKVISRTGTANPKLLSGGISEALITTELGLIVAVPLLLVYAALRGWVHRREAMLEYTAIRAFGIRDQEEESA